MTAKNKKWDKVYKSIFKSNLLNEKAWLEKANDLLDTAYLLEKKVNKVWDALKQASNGKGEKPRTGYFATHFMLIAFAIENVLKAKIISKNRIKFRKFIKEKGRLPNVLKSHDLYKLANYLNIPLDLKEEGFLRRLTRAVKWAGRYPVPLSFKELMSKKYSDGKEYMESYFTKDEIKEVKKLLIKLFEA